MISLTTAYFGNYTKTSNAVELLSLRILWQLAILRVESCDMTQLKIQGIYN